jgi:hypothetical protein
MTQILLDKIEITDTFSLEMNRLYTGFDDAVSSRGLGFMVYCLWAED